MVILWWFYGDSMANVHNFCSKKKKGGCFNLFHLYGSDTWIYLDNLHLFDVWVSLKKMMGEDDL